MLNLNLGVLVDLWNSVWVVVTHLKELLKSARGMFWAPAFESMRQKTDQTSHSNPFRSNKELIYVCLYCSLPCGGKIKLLGYFPHTWAKDALLGGGQFSGYICTIKKTGGKPWDSGKNGLTMMSYQIRTSINYFTRRWIIKYAHKIASRYCITAEYCHQMN